jgi:hypothetical protein
VQLEKEGKTKTREEKEGRKLWVEGGEKLVKSLPKTTKNSKV